MNYKTRLADHLGWSLDRLDSHFGGFLESIFDREWNKQGCRGIRLMFFK